MKTLLSILLISLPMAAQTVVNPTQFTMDATTLGALARWMMTQTTPSVAPTLTVAVDTTSTSFQLSSGTGLGATSALVIDGNEIVQCTAKPTGASFTCTRAQVGTTAVAHSIGATVKELTYKTPATASGAIAKNAVIALCLADPVITAGIATAQATAQAAVAAGVQ
jgi:hypothetical protein